MQKKNFVSMILGTIGGILFALGMCMCLLPEWGAFGPGVVIAAVGAVVLLAMIFVRRKMEALGVGMCMTMIWNMLVPGILIGIVGIVLLLCLIPLIMGLK